MNWVIGAAYILIVIFIVDESCDILKRAFAFFIATLTFLAAYYLVNHMG